MIKNYLSIFYIIFWKEVNYFMKWNVVRYNINKGDIETYNIFAHGKFREEVDDLIKNYENEEKFKSKVKSSLLYYFFARAEWEVFISPWIGSKKGEIKVDVYWQIMNNFDQFIDYILRFNGIK